MLIRFVSAIIALAGLLLVLFTGGVVLYVVAFLAGLYALYEFHRAFKLPFVLCAVGGLFYAHLMIDLIYWQQAYLFTGIMAYILIVTSLGLINKNTMKQSAMSAFGILYIAVLFLSLLNIFLVDSRYLWYVFLIAFMTDTSAYFSGTFFGRRKLIPDVSPNKTVEGSIGGVLGCMASTVIFSLIFYPDLMVSMLPVAFLGSMVSQIGDLAASKLKREAEVKDFGTLMPGHGGLLDRIDSILFVGPIILMYLNF